MGDSGYQTVTLVQGDNDANNYVLYLVKQSDKNDETSNISMEITQDDVDPDDPDTSNIYDFNDGEDQSKKSIIVVSMTQKSLPYKLFFFFTYLMIYLENERRR